MNSRNIICALLLACALLVAPFTPVVAATALARSVKQDDSPSDAEQAMFTKGQDLFNQGEYERAADVFKDFIKTYPNSFITDLTLLWLGRSYYRLNRFQDAEQVSRRLRAIRDTPFADIYDSELRAARSETASNAGSTSGTNATSASVATTTTDTSSAVADARRNSNATAARDTATKPAPTPTVAQLSATVRPPLNINRATTQATTSSTTMSAAANNRNTNRSSRARVISAIPPSTVTQTVNNQSVETRQSNSNAGRGAVRRTATTTTANAANQNSVNALNQSARNTRTTTTTTTTVVATPIEQQVAVVAPTPPRSIVANTRSNSSSISSVATNSTTNSTLAVTQSANAQTTPNEIAASQEGVRLTIKQVPNLELALRRTAEAASPGQTIQMPLTITNTGNKEDQFRLETDLPAEFQPTFSTAQNGSDTGLPIYVTPQLARGASVDVLLNLRVPETAADGQQRRFFVRAASQSDYQVLRVADGAINILAASLAAVSNVSATSVLPGDTFTQTITVRNAGSAAARSSRADFVFNPAFELVNASPSPLVYDRASRTAIWSMGDLGARDSRDITVTLRAVPNALALTNSLGRGTLRTQSLPFASNFDSPSIAVGKVARARIDAVSVGLTTTPGDTIFVPFVVRNPGNSPDAYELAITAPGAPSAIIFADTNGDGQHQDSEPSMTQTASLEAQDGQSPMLLRVQIPSNTPDRQQFSYSIVARSVASNRVASEANTVLTVATPRVRVRTEQVTDAVDPGDTIFYRLVLINEGSGLAKNLVVNETLPDAMQFVNSEPSLNPQDLAGHTQRFTWRVTELAPGDTAVLRIAVRLRPNISADTSLTTSHTLTYQDTNGNGYQNR